MSKIATVIKKIIHNHILAHLVVIPSVQGQGLSPLSMGYLEVDSLYHSPFFQMFEPLVGRCARAAQSSSILPKLKSYTESTNKL